MIRAFLNSYFAWAFSHTLYNPPRYLGNYLAIFTFCPVLWFLAVFARGVPKAWLIVLGLFAVPILLAPAAHYVLPMLPFLCLIAAMGFRKYWGERNIFEAIIFGICLGFMMAGIAKDLVRPWRYHSYSVMDTEYYADVIRKAGPLKPPIWINWPPLYFSLGWTPPVNDFINAGQIDMGREIDWTKEPYSLCNTRILLGNGDNYRQLLYECGWNSKAYKLNHGQFDRMVIQERE